VTWSDFKEEFKMKKSLYSLTIVAFVFCVLRGQQLSGQATTPSAGCKGPGCKEAVVGAGDVHSAKVPPFQYNFNVVSQYGVDANGFLYRPQWAWQQLEGNADLAPDPAICHNFSAQGGPDPALGAGGGILGGILGAAALDIIAPELIGLGLGAGGIAGTSVGSIPLKEPSFADCTDQANESTVDLPSGSNKLVCETGEIANGRKSFTGHVNWSPVTLEGTMGCCDYSQGHPEEALGDHDYTFTFKGQGPNEKSLDLSTYKDGLHAEFDSQETIDNFKLSKEWWDLRLAVQGNHETAEEAYMGHVIVTGLFGLDGEHDLKPELHPVYALALQHNLVEAVHSPVHNPWETPGPSEDMWLMFVRNQGDEGYCSSDVWDGYFEDYTFQLPWKDGMTHVEVNGAKGKTSFWGTDGTYGPVVTVVPSTRPTDFGKLLVNVKFHIGPSAKTAKDVDPSDVSVPIIFGALYLDWSAESVASGAGSQAGSSGSKPAVSKPPTQVAASSHNEESEVSLAKTISKLTPAQRALIAKASVIPAGHPVAMHQLAAPAPIQVLKEVPAEDRQVKPAVMRAVRVGPATRKNLRDEAQLRALCAATKNVPPGLPPSVCMAVAPAQPAAKP
jgi:hypothetical protein